MILIPAWLNSFLTPIFLIGTGVILGLLTLVVLWGVVWLVSRPAAQAIPRMVMEGPLAWILWIAVAFAVAAFGIGWVAYDRTTLLTSLARLPSTGTIVARGEAEPAPTALAEPPAVEVPMRVRGDEIKEILVISNEPIEVGTPSDVRGGARSMVVEANETEPRQNRNREFAGMELSHWVVKNQGDQTARFEIRVVTQPEHPEVMASVITAACLVGLVLFYVLHASIFKKMTAIALAASKSEMAHPLYWLMLGLGAVMLMLFVVIPYFTFGEDIKVLKDSGLVLILTFSILHTVLASSNQVSDEIEGKTAMTVLSKPVSRIQFILGKFLGLAWVELVMIVALGAVFVLCIAYKAIYDSGETASELPTWQNVYREVARTVPGLVLVFFEVLVFTAISIAIATRLPLLANFVICFFIYAVGHLTQRIVQSGTGRNEVVEFIARLIATVFPGLDFFNIYAGIAQGNVVPLSYLAMSGVYCLLLCAVAILLALALFDDRDLA